MRSYEMAIARNALCGLGVLRLDILLALAGVQNYRLRSQISVNRDGSRQLRFGSLGRSKVSVSFPLHSASAGTANSLNSPIPRPSTVGNTRWPLIFSKMSR